VFDHVDIRVRDLAASRRFYETVLAALAIDVSAESDESVEFGAFGITGRTPPTPAPLHFAFIAETREQVDAFHRAGIEAGYRDNGAPGIRKYGDDYYAAFLLDPDGHNVEAVHRSEATRRRWTWLGRGLPGG
jgi:catechol 2,3-dioxygenase-like lactoylglutathione lyase family enzyme